MAKQRIIIVGGLSAGPSAAAKARRTDENAEILMFESTSHISYATCGIPYALSGKISSRDKLMIVQPELLEKRFGIEVHLNEPVNDIDPQKRLVFTDKGVYEYDKLIFATGGRAVLPPIENIERYDNWAHAKTIADFDKVMKRGVIEQSDHITIIGAGLVGLETAENLVHAGKKVTVVELGHQILANWEVKFAAMAEQVLKRNGVEVRLGVSVTAVDPATSEIILSNGERFFTDFIFVGVSIKPNTSMLTAKGAAHLPNGALIVNERMESTLPNIYAAGDCAAVANQVTGAKGWFPMGTHSNKGGRAAGANAAGGHERFAGAYGTAILKVFEYTVARTGMGPRALAAAGLPFNSSLSVAGSTPSFFPDQKDIVIELYYSPESGKIYGAELFGEKGVDKRVDVLATAVYAGLTIYDLPQLDLAYAPPYSPAKDPVIVAGYVAADALNAAYTEMSIDEAARLFSTTEDYTLLDVRTPTEVHRDGAIEGAVNIPLDELRASLDQLDKKRKHVVYCAKGLRGYLASLILVHHGFESVHNISGGFLAWKQTYDVTSLSTGIVV